MSTKTNHEVIQPKNNSPMKAIVKFLPPHKADINEFNTAYGVLENALNEACVGTIVYDIPDHTGFEVQIDTGAITEDIPEEVNDCFDSAFMTLSEDFGIEMRIVEIIAD